MRMNNEEKILQMLGDLKAGQDAMATRLERVEAGQEELRGEVAKLSEHTHHTRVLLEGQEHNIRLIAEQYGDIAEKLDKANDRAAQLDDMRDRVRTLETVVMNHTVAIREMRKAE